MNNRKHASHIQTHCSRHEDSQRELETLKAATEKWHELQGSPLRLPADFSETMERLSHSCLYFASCCPASPCISSTCKSESHFQNENQTTWLMYSNPLKSSTWYSECILSFQLSGLSISAFITMVLPPLLKHTDFIKHTGFYTFPFFCLSCSI